MNALSSFRLGNICRNAHQRWQNSDWSAADKKLLQADSIDELPLHLRFVEFIISTHGNRNWVNQNGVVIPGNSVVRLFDANGSMEMGWNRPVRPTGHFYDNNEVLGPPDGGFTVTGANRYCMLVRTPAIWLRNGSIPNYGASVGDSYWDIGANDGGQCSVAFNDNDNNNSGTFTQRLVVYPARVFAEIARNLLTQ